MGDCINCKSIDNRVSVFILIETLRKLNNFPYDVYGVFTVQEEVGIRGAQVSALQIKPNFGFGLAGDPVAKSIRRNQQKREKLLRTK